jgi:hypothetical protein
MVTKSRASGLALPHVLALRYWRIFPFGHFVSGVTAGKGPVCDTECLTQVKQLIPFIRLPVAAMVRRDGRAIPH